MEVFLSFEEGVIKVAFLLSPLENAASLRSAPILDAEICLTVGGQQKWLSVILPFSR